jgi:hypothetical protein
MRVIGEWSVSSFVKVLLDAACYITAIFLVLSACLFVFMIFSDLGANGTLDIPVAVEVEPQTYNIASSSLGIEGAQIRIQDVRAHLQFPAQRNAFAFGTLSTLTIFLALALWVLTQLRQIFRTLRNGQPFLPANAGRIRRLGLAVILGELVRAAVAYSGNYYMMSHFTAAGIRFAAPVDISVMALIHGLLIIVVAEVFRAGSLLEEEKSLTI